MTTPANGPDAAPATERGRRQAAILLGKGGYGSSPREELERMAAAVRASGRYSPVETAFVDLGTPALPAALQRCVDAGAERILVAAVFVPMDRSLRIWLPYILRRWLRRRQGPHPGRVSGANDPGRGEHQGPHPGRVSGANDPGRGEHQGCAVEVVLAGAIGDRPGLGQAVLDLLAAGEGAPPLGAGTPGEYGNPGWSVIPPYRYQAFFCTGPRCTTRGAGDLLQHLRDRLAEHRLASGANRVHLVRTGCLYPCNLGPVMTVYPDGVWYCSITERAVERIVQEHFAGGQVVEAYTRRPGGRRQTRPAPAVLGDVVEDDPPA